MCLAFPAKIISINEDNIATVEISGNYREACLDIVDEEVAVGDYVICHAGYAVHKIDETLANEKLSFLKELVDIMAKDDNSGDEETGN